MMQLLILDLIGPDADAADQAGVKLGDKELPQWTTLFQRAKQISLSEDNPPDISALSPDEARTHKATDLLNQVSTALKSMRALDLSLTLHLVHKAHAAAELVRGKDVIALLGPTGAGKSTTIHFLAGTQLVSYELYGLMHIGPEPRQPILPQLRNITCSPLMKSETRFVHALTLPCSTELDPSGTITLCDTPGFGDTEGAETDLANCLGIYHALKHCRSVRFVVLFSGKALGDRLGGMEEIATILAQLMPNFSQDVQSALPSSTSKKRRSSPRKWAFV
jgi:energy-coupling factor transporter ATP-binding protein EcfA2